jgi:hypothetical protein
MSDCLYGCAGGIGFLCGSKYSMISYGNVPEAALCNFQPIKYQSNISLF